MNLHSTPSEFASDKLPLPLLWCWSSLTSSQSHTS